MPRLWIALCLLVGPAARAEPVRLKLASMAPSGTSWAREIEAFGRELSGNTAGAMQAKWYLGGIAGDEFATIERIRKGQLDGAAISLGCEQLAPSLRALRVVGLIQSRAEARHVIARLHQRIDQEFKANGFVNLGVINFGSIVLFSRSPVSSLAEMRRLRLWVWDRDEIWITLLRAIGLEPVPLPVEAAARAYDEHRIDGFLAVPGAALVFQWSTQTPYYTDQRLGLLPACLVLSQRSMDALTVTQRAQLTDAAARLSQRFELVGEQLDDALLGGVFQKQGLKRVQTDAAFTSQFFDAAQVARAALDPKLLPPDLLREVISWLLYFRGEQGRAH